MERLQISLIDLNPASRSQLEEELRTLFQKESPPIQIQSLSATGETASLYDQLQRTERPDVLFLILPTAIGESERSLIKRFKAAPNGAPMIAVIEDAPASEILGLFKLGIADFISPPLRSTDLLPRLWKLTEHFRKKSTLFERLKECVGLRQMIGRSVVFTAELNKIPLIANCDSSVLISGDTGTGKEMFARSIHYLGPRADKAFTPVNCGAIPPDLMENELFGHARGAFTSAATSQTGLIEESDGGTLFLDEINTLTLAAQVKLLRFLQDKEYRQLGSAKTRRADVRIIAATNSNLEQAVNEGCFRRDLYYRLNIIALKLPSLHQRRSDIPALATHFLKHYNEEMHKAVEEITPEAMQMLVRYDWPGNVRELQNVVERAIVFATGPSLNRSDIILPLDEPSSPSESFQEAKARVVVEFEKNYIKNLLSTHGGNITRAAETAGKNRRAFWELIRKHEIDKSLFKGSN